jgi:hypothetical protein
MNYILILGFANRPTAERTLAEFMRTKTSDAQVVVLDNHYPGMSDFWLSWCTENDAMYIDAGKNLGLHHGLNFMLKQLGAKKGDKIIGFDPDTNPETVGWDEALFRALDIQNVVWASLWNDHSAGEMRERGWTGSVENGLNIWQTHKPVVNSICAFDVGWVLDVCGFQEPTEYYGGLECAMFALLKKRWVWLCDYKEGKFDVDLQDIEYKNYKWAHAHLGWQGSFDTWLKNRQKNS